MTGDTKLQRAFSSFPSGFPGLALLLQRLAVGAIAVAQFTWLLVHHLPAIWMMIAAFTVISGLCLILGLVTPLVSGLQCSRRQDRR